MELLNNSRTEYLLDATLESLHDESVSWLKELDFWGDEMSFFYKLLQNKKVSGSFPSSEMAEIEKELIRLNGDMLDKVKAGVSSHERMLASVVRSTSLSDEQSYREKHKQLLDEMNMLQAEIRKFKKAVFAFI